MRLGILMIVGIFLFGCKDKPRVEFWKVDKFNFEGNAMENGAKVRLLYSNSGLLNSQTDSSFYVHTIVVELSSKDTFNILEITKFGGYSPEDGDRTFEYYDEDHMVSKLLDVHPFENQDGDMQEMVEKLKSGKLKRLNNVYRDPKFDYIADNQHTTLVGNLVPEGSYKFEANETQD